MNVIESRATRTPAFWEWTPPPYDYPYCLFVSDHKSKQDKVKVIDLKNKCQKIIILEFCKQIYTRHTFWCLIRCINIKWIQWVLLKIQSVHDPLHWRTDGQTDGQDKTSIPPFQLLWILTPILFCNGVSLTEPLKTEIIMMPTSSSLVAP